MSEGRGTVYVIPQTTWASGDIGGCLLHEEGDVTNSHLSSSLRFLVGDLTITFKDRREALEARYPHGYDVVVCGEGVDIPQDVLDANKEWAAE